MLDTLKEMIQSKKAIAMIAGLLVTVVAKVGLDLDVDAIGVIIAPVIAYIIGQGWADTGKEVEKIRKAM